MPRRPLPPLPLCPPADVHAVVAIERADQFLDETRRLLGLLPWVLGAAVKTALAAAPRVLGLGDLEVLDARAWRQRGLDLAGGLALWINDARLAFVGAFHDASAVDGLARAVLRASGGTRFENADSLTLAFSPAGEVIGAFGIVDRFVWATLVKTAEEARSVHAWIAASHADRLTAANADATTQNDPTGDRGRGAPTLPAHTRLLHGLRGPSHALRVVIAETAGAMGVSVTPEDREIVVAFEAPPSNDSIAPLRFLCRPRKTRGAAMPRGALVVLSGVDLGEIVREARDDDGRGGAQDARGVGVLAIHEIDAGITRKLEGAWTPEALLNSGMLHASFWMRPDDIERWTNWVADEVELEHGHIEGVGAAATYVLPAGVDKSSHVRIAFEEGALIASLTEDDLRELRHAARGTNEALGMSIRDPEARMLLDRGEPFLYVQVAALAERFGGLAESLWKDGNIGKSFGAREALQVLGRIDDVTLHVRLDTDAPIRGWCKLRLR